MPSAVFLPPILEKGQFRLDVVFNHHPPYLPHHAFNITYVDLIRVGPEALGFRPDDCPEYEYFFLLDGHADCEVDGHNYYLIPGSHIYLGATRVGKPYQMLAKPGTAFVACSHLEFRPTVMTSTNLERETVFTFSHRGFHPQFISVLQTFGPIKLPRRTPKAREHFFLPGSIPNTAGQIEFNKHRSSMILPRSRFDCPQGVAFSATLEANTTLLVFSTEACPHADDNRLPWPPLT